MIALCKSLTTREKSKLLTEVIGNRQGKSGGWLTEVTRVRMNDKMARPDQQTIKSNAFDMLVAMIEGEKA